MLEKRMYIIAETRAADLARYRSIGASSVILSIVNRSDINLRTKAAHLLRLFDHVRLSELELVYVLCSDDDASIKAQHITRLITPSCLDDLSSDIVDKVLSQNCKVVTGWCAARKCSDEEMRAHFSRYFPQLSQPENPTDLRMKFKVACELSQRASEQATRLLHILEAPTYLLARRRDAEGNPMTNGEYRLYPCFVLSFVETAFGTSSVKMYAREHEGLCTPMNPSRVFVRATQNAALEPRFNGHMAATSLMNYTPRLDDSDREIRQHLLPLFGWIDASNIMANYMQNICINPQLVL